MSKASANFYAKAIIKNQRTFEQCPSQLKEEVRQALIEMGHPELIIEEEIPQEEVEQEEAEQKETEQPTAEGNEEKKEESPEQSEDEKNSEKAKK